MTGGYGFPSRTAIERRPSFPVAILAGGLAIRMRPITEDIPKALIPVEGEPFAFHQLRLLAGRGVSKVVFCIAHFGFMIQDAVGDGSAFGLTVYYSEDGEKLVGTAGAIRRALPLLGENFMVVYGDSYLDVDYGAVARTFLLSGKPALMTVIRNGGKWDKSNTLVNGAKIVLYDKHNPTPDMEHLDYGIGVFHASLFRSLAPGAFADLSDMYHRLSLSGDLACHVVTERPYEIGSPGGLEDFRRYIAARKAAAR